MTAASAHRIESLIGIGGLKRRRAVRYCRRFHAADVRHGLQPRRATADKGDVTDSRSGFAVWTGVLFVCLGGCSHSHTGPGGRVSMADLRAGKLPVAAEVCIAGVATYYDSIAGTLVVQDQTGAIKLGNVNIAGPMSGQRTEVCGETRRTLSGMTLAKPNVKTLGNAGLPAAKRTSPGEWSKGRVDWEWIEVAGTPYAETVSRIGPMILHMVVDGRRVRVKILGTDSHPSLANLDRKSTRLNSSH